MINLFMNKPIARKRCSANTEMTDAKCRYVDVHNELAACKGLLLVLEMMVCCATTPLGVADLCNAVAE